jgi:hypothetical protein
MTRRVKTASPKKTASARSLKARWLRRLRKTHEVLLHAEVVAACLGELAIAVDESGASSFHDVVIRPLFHWSSLMVRGICVEGTRPSNVSLGRLLMEFNDHSAVFLKVSRQAELRKWLGAVPTEALIAKKVIEDARSLGANWPNHGLHRSKRRRDPTKEYANSVAHPQTRELRLRGRLLRERREKARQLVEDYQRLLSRKTLTDGVRERWIQRFQDDLDRLA